MNLYFANFYVTETHKPGQRCTDLIELTANSLSNDVVDIMLMAVQKDNLEMSINRAIKR